MSRSVRRAAAYVASLALILMSSGPALAAPAGIGTAGNAGEICLALAEPTDCCCPEKKCRQKPEAAVTVRHASDSLLGSDSVRGNRNTGLIRIGATDLLSDSGSDCSCSPTAPGSGSERPIATSVSVHQFRMAKTKILPPFSNPVGDGETNLALRCRSRLVELSRAAAEPPPYLLIQSLLL